ncbi:rRNA methyltransferase 2, mitochondrial isoform 3-T3 [Tautogolabrus adspersus]
MTSFGYCSPDTAWWTAELHQEPGARWQSRGSTQLGQLLTCVFVLHNHITASACDASDPNLPHGTVIGVDLLNIPPLDGAHFLSSHDVTDPATHAKLLELLPHSQAHVILSDMAPNASGFRDMDHEKLILMCLSLIDLAAKILQPGGSLLCKYWDGILTHELQEKLSGVFGCVRTLKPNASRKDSAERYFLAGMYRKQEKRL